MPIGSVIYSLQAVIDLKAFGSETDIRTIQVTVDTGFSDYLMLPRETIMSLKWPLLGYSEATLANGMSVLLDTYASSVFWEGHLREVPVLASSSGSPLIGMSLLYGSRLTVDIVDGGEVSIIPIPLPTP